jgi:GT2 family glycosyltransferase
LWLNPDTLVNEGAVTELAACLRGHPDAGAVGPKLVGPDGSLQYSCRTFPSLSTALFTRQSLSRRLWPSNPLSRRYLLSDWDHSEVRAVDWVSGAALMTSRAVVDRVGPLDEQFFLFHEDVDWCRRVHAAGLRVYYDPKAVLVHHEGISSARVPPRLIIERHRGMLRYYRKHMRRGPWLDVAVLVGVATRAGIQLLTRSRWRETK